MSVNFITNALEENEISSEIIFKQETNRLYNAIKTKGVSMSQMSVILNGLKYLQLDDKLFKNLIRCLIPNAVIPKRVIQKVMEWIFDLRTELTAQNLVKIESLLVWIASLLEFELIHKSIDDWYYLFDSLLEFFVKPVSHILYILTKPADVTIRTMNKIQELSQVYENDPCLCALLNHFKKLNPEFSSVKVPQRKKDEKVFSYHDSVYVDLRAGLKNVKKQCDDTIAEPVAVPSKIQKISKEHLLPDPYYNPDTQGSQQGYCYIHNIANGAQLGKNFRELILPSHMLTLMKSEVGIYVLMFSKRSLQDNFYRNLYAVLQKSFITEVDEVSTIEKEDLLNNIITLHLLFQQGFLCVSKFLSVFLERWDGITFKNQILMLVEWFVFKTESDLQNYLMKPLYTLFVIGSGDVELMCDILICLTNLISNLLFMIRKEKSGLGNIYKEEILHSREQLEPVLKNLFAYFAHLCEHGLYQFPCNTRILRIAIDFYYRVDKLDDEHLNARTIVSPSVLYHSLFSANAEMLNEVCALMPSYRIKMLDEKYLSSGMDDTLMRYAKDLFNFLWTSKAFTHRSEGYIFSHLTSERKEVWSRYTNLNIGLDILRHIMFEPYRSLAVKDRGLPNRQFTIKDDVLEILREHVPHIVKFLDTVFENMPPDDKDATLYIGD